MFGRVRPALAESHQVIAVDLQGHGRTADIDRPIDVSLTEEEIIADLVYPTGREGGG